MLRGVITPFFIYNPVEGLKKAKEGQTFYLPPL